MVKIPLPRAGDSDVEQAGCPRREARQIPGHLRRELPLTTGSAGVPQSKAGAASGSP